MAVDVEGGSYKGRWFGRELAGMVVKGGKVVHVVAHEDGLCKLSVKMHSF